MTDRQLDQIGERFQLWIDHRDGEALRDEDLRDVLAELIEMRRQHKHDVALLTTARERLAAVNDDYRELLSRLGQGDDERAAAEAHAAAQREAP